MMHAAGVGIGSGEDKIFAAHAIDSTDMQPVAADDLHMLHNLAHATELGGALFPPVAKVLIEHSLLFTPVFVIVAIKRRHLAFPPYLIFQVIFPIMLDIAARGRG